MKRVLIALKYVPRYRESFLNGLRTRLREEGVVLDLVYGDPDEVDRPKGDAAILDWATHVRSRHLDLRRGRSFVYQPIVRRALSYDLVIVEQATRLLVNVILLVLNGLGTIRLAYWGHGRNFQGDDGRMARRVKRFLTPLVHWWFTYNETSALAVRETGFADERITRVMNTTDNEELVKYLGEVTDREVAEKRRALGLKGGNVCIYVGSIYDLKNIRFLLAACERIRAQVPDFEIIFLGGGPDRPLVDEFATRHDWAVSCGPTYARDKAVSLKLAKLHLMPGLVGLAVIDSFASQVPIVTTNVPWHSPEIEYLVDGVNGVMVPNPDDVEGYASRVVGILRDDSLLETLRAGCRESAPKYSVRAMVDRFAAGVLGALNGGESPMRRRESVNRLHATGGMQPR